MQLTQTELSLSERDTLKICEEAIQMGIRTFVEVGNALLTIRDQKLYRQTHKTFEDYCRQRWEMSRPRAYQLIESAEIVQNLSTIVDILPNSESQTRPLASLEPGQQREAWQNVLTSNPDGKITAEKVLQAAEAIKTESTGGKIKPMVTVWTGDEENYTPAEYIEAARSAMGSIDLDPASNDFAQKTVKAKLYYTKDDDGLKRKWKGNVFLNPPYSHIIKEFVNKLAQSVNDGSVPQAVLLTNNNTDTAWFHCAAINCSRICFTVGRISFYKETGVRTSPTNGQTFFYFGKSPERFGKAFSEIGLIMEVVK